ncbi:hypothetical protein TSMEX_009080 [Taenia solium]|eukprot:TsM_000106100 transcript=TsM_000106100 gene=TsM_000106100
MPGYTGLRCDLYDLSITLATLSQFRTATVDIEILRPEDSATMYSVLDATAIFLGAPLDQPPASAITA